MERSPFQLSFGEMRRVAFAIAHALAPDLLLLDEPASCLDRAGRDVLDALVAARTDAGAAVVIVSHDPVSLAHRCDRVLALEGGRVRPRAG
jgi:ABC-type glutathione transport system ATPase component